MTNKHTHPPKTPKRSTDAKAGRKGRGTRTSQERKWAKTKAKVAK